MLLPAIAFARERELITTTEAHILQIGAQKGIAKAADLGAAMPGMTMEQRTYQIRKLVERKMLLPIKEGARQYTLGFRTVFCCAALSFTCHTRFVATVSFSLSHNRVGLGYFLSSS
ncbi:hypothetical protein SAMN04488082_11460 [Desulfomicrobium apsheronum]|uniref:Uncharacterized protein n=1 Tax=Desulfomicrobium apsheronum TaxID=52560 RepID=A0A1I3WUE9_9BACT|nr:hypothetical protein SAMN04488082_11460 [Desulfomicrobium apsheronum]